MLTIHSIRNWSTLRTALGYLSISISKEAQDLSPDDKGVVLCYEEINIRKIKDGWRYESPTKTFPVNLRVSADYTTLSLYHPTQCEAQLQGAQVDLFIRTAIECMLSFHDMISLHAACVEVDGKAVAFTAPSGVGKSTRARAWTEQLGAEFISGDRPVIRLEGHGAVACGVPWDGKEQIMRDVERPLAAVFEIRRAPFCTLRKLSVSQSRRVLMQQCFIPMWDNASAVAAMSVIRRMADSVPIYRLFCGPDGESAQWAYDALFVRSGGTMIKEEQQDMKIKEGFVLRNIVGEDIVLPIGDNINKFEGALVLNEVSAFLWESLKAPICKEDLLGLLLAEFDVDVEIATMDIDAFLDQLREHGILDEEKA